MKSVLITIYLLTSISVATAQQYADSLWKVWNNQSASVEDRLLAIDELAWVGYLFTNPDSAFICAEMMYQFASLNNRKDFEAQALNTQAISFYLKGDYENSVLYHNKCLQTYIDLDDKKGQAKSHNNIGAVYGDQGNQNLALEHYFQSLKIAEEINDTKSIAGSMANIGIIYFGQGDYEKALEYYQKSHLIHLKDKNQQGIAISYNNIGTVYSAKNENEKAIEYFQKSLEIAVNIGDKHAEATSYDLIGKNYVEQKTYIIAMNYFSKALEIRTEIGDRKGAASTMVSMGQVYQKRGNKDEALKILIKARLLAEEIGVNQEQMMSSKALYELYKDKKDYHSSLEMFEEYVKLKDSIRDEESEKKLIQQQFQFEYQSKVSADSITNAEKDKVNKALSEKQEAEIEAQNNKQIALFLGLGLITIFSIFVVNRLVVIRKQKSIIEHQKDLVEVKNKEISDSINYAKRIQEAILPSRDALNNELKDGFILYKPKDIVSGDFYWLEKTSSSNENDNITERKVYFAAADCTGHGVPGAMISVICSNALSKALLEEKKEETGELLDKAREIIINRLAKNNQEVKDGMDISLASITYQYTKNDEFIDNKNIMQWSGANNSLWIVRQNNKEPLKCIQNQKLFELYPDLENEGNILFEVKPDKQPVALYDKMKPFTSISITIHKGDCIYLFTDGFADQFGGDLGKKMKSSHFKKLVLEMQHLDMDNQKVFLDNQFENWRKQTNSKNEIIIHDQLDDVCVIGVKIT